MKIQTYALKSVGTIVLLHDSGPRESCSRSDATRVVSRHGGPFARHAGGAAPEAREFVRLLVAIDDSDPADAAIDLAIAFAREKNVRLLFCTAAAMHARDGIAARRAVHADARDLVDAARDRAVECGVAADTSVIEGDPASELLDAAARVHADLIVIGSHGRRGLQRLLLGSVAEHVVRRSAPPVLVVRLARRTLSTPVGETALVPS